MCRSLLGRERVGMPRSLCVRDQREGATVDHALCCGHQNCYEELRFCWIQVTDWDGPERGKPSRPLSQPRPVMATAGVCILLWYGQERWFRFADQ